MCNAPGDHHPRGAGTQQVGPCTIFEPPAVPTAQPSRSAPCMNPHQQLIDGFYAAFARLDADAMAACYAPDAMFEDEVFQLRGKQEVMGMWRMLCETVRRQGAEHWKLEWSDVDADDYGGQAHWEAWYRFSATGRLVHNRINARFGFNNDGLIVVHRDRFDFALWSRQALGLPGLLLGRTRWLRQRVRAQAAQRLEHYLQKGVA